MNASLSLGHTARMRPHIICHMIGSVDSRLLPSRWSPLAGETQDNALVIGERYKQVADRFGAEGFIIGRKTMEEFDGVISRTPAAPRAPATARSHHLARAPGQSVAVVVDPAGKLHYPDGTIDGDHLIAVLGQNVADEYLEELRASGVSYVFAGPAGHDMGTAMQTLGEQFGLKLLLLEGGGIINGAFLQAGLIDEISVLIYPGIDGLSGVPNIFDHHGEADSRPAAGQTLRLLSTEVLEGGFVWIHYRVERL